MNKTKHKKNSKETKIGTKYIYGAPFKKILLSLQNAIQAFYLL